MRARQLATSIARGAIDRFDLEARVREALPPLPPPRANVVVVAVGKAAPRMARAAIDRWPTRIARMLVVTTDGTDVSMLDGAPTPIDVRRASHPLPDARSVEAAEAALAFVRGEAHDLRVVMISGGASSLLCAPVDRISLEKKRQIVRSMLDAGAPIEAVNVVRRHLSRIKGGGLARAALPGRTLALVVSDVLVARPTGAGENDVIVGGTWDVGSGPASADPTTIDDARAALARWAPQHAADVEHAWTTNLSTDEPIARRAQARLVATPLDLVEQAAIVARDLGLRVEVMPPSLDAVDVLAAAYVERARALAPGTALLRVAEPSVALPSEHARGKGARGKGGRAGRLALRAWSIGLPADVALACVASDGVDGSSEAAGAVVSGAAPEGARDALDRFDDGPFLAAHDAALASRPTGTNLLDLHVIVRDR